ncbi:kalirin-like [Branchiostoma lanceolatum]|uniref:kalirin-like n=1 Tax=Branchiostoma lanceolatum TaxID=7740 RepID=UPI0034514300
MATATVPRRSSGQAQNGSMPRRKEHSQSHRSSYPPRNVGGSRSPMYLPSSPGEDDVFVFPDTASTRSAHSRSETNLLRKPINHQGPLRHSQSSLRPTQGVLKFAQQPAHLSKGPYESWSTLRTAQGAGTNSVSSSVPPSSITYPNSSKTSQVSQDVYVRRDTPNFVPNKYYDPRSPRRPVTRSQSPPAPRSISSSTRRSPSPKALSNSGRSSSSPKENTNSLRHASQNATGRKSPAPTNTADRKAAEKGLPKFPASAVEVVLRKRICFLSGGRDKRRGPIITFPTHPAPVDFSPEEIGLNVAFLASVPSPESKSRGFSVIIDVRAPTWRANKSLVKVLQQTLGRQLAQVIIVKPDTFWDKQKTSFRYRNDKAEGGYETIMVTASKIFQYVDQDQLTKDLGGTLPYDHDDWVQKRLDMEKFARDSVEMCQQLDHLEHAVNTQLLSDTIAIGDKFIFQYNHFRRKARTVAVETINFGKELLGDLQKFIESGFASDYSKHTEDTVVAIATVKKQLSAVEGRENKLLDLLEEQIREEVYGMQLSSLEKGAKQVVEWILGTGQQMLGSNHRIGQNLTSAESYRKEHEQIQLRCSDIFAKYSELTHKAELLLQEGYGVTDDIKAQRDYMDTVCRNFASRMERRRNLLVSSVKFLRVAQGLSRALDSLLEQVLSDTIPEDVQAAERAIGRIQEFGENVEREFKEAMKEGQVLMDLLSGLVKDAFGKDVTPDHTRDFQHTKNKLEDLERRKLRCDELGDVRKLRLQQILQLRTCERDADQAIQWIEELCVVMVRTHTDVGKSAGEAGRLKEEHDKFQSTAKSTYDYGKQLLQAALVLRRSCHYNCQPNHLKAVKLEKAWNKFSKCLDERASRLFITHDFHKKADTLLLDMRNLIHSMQLGAAADSLQESAARMMVRRREETEDEYEETMRMGNSLMVRLAMPIMDQTSQHKVAEDTREAIDLVQKKQKQLDVRKKEVEDVWKEHRKRLEAPLKIRQLHREMKQSLQDIQLRIADAMPGLLEVGRSLEEAKRLKKQHEDLMGKLKGKQGHVNELLHQADNVVINKEPDLDVYEAMAESLGEAWKDLNAQLEDRRLLLDAAILFHESVKQFTDKLNMAHRLFSPLTLPQDVDTIRLQLQKHHQTKKEILEASMETMNRGQVLLDRMQDMGSHIESRHATTAACYGVEHMLENLHDRRRHMEEVWALQKLRLEKSLQLCIWKQEVNDVTAFYKSQGESYMNASNLGENAPATQILIDLHREITDKAKPMYDQVKRLLRVAESFIVGGHYDSPTIQSMAGNLHVQWETFMDRLDRRTKYLQLACDFYQQAGEAIKKLESIDIQLSVQTRQADSTAKLAMLHASLAHEILETVSPPLRDGYILIDLIGRGKPQLAGIEQKVDELEGWKKELDERCQAHLEDAQQKGEMFLVFQERHAHLFTWLTGVVDTFLAMHADLGTILPAALEFLSNHERLEKDMKDREPQVDIVLQAAEEFMKTGAVEAHECDVKTRDIQAHWGRVGRVVRKRISLGAIYVAFHKLARRLANEMDDLDELLKRIPTDGTKGLEIAIHRHDDQWKEVQEAFTVMERKGREFLSEVKLVRDDPQLDTERAVLCVETLLEHFGERKRMIQDQRTSWQQKLQAEEEFKQDWLRFMEEVRKTIEWIVSLEREIFPSSGADLGTNLEDAADLQDKLRKFLPTAEVNNVCLFVCLLCLGDFPQQRGRPGNQPGGRSRPAGQAQEVPANSRGKQRLFVCLFVVFGRFSPAAEPTWEQTWRTRSTCRTSSGSSCRQQR